MDKSVLKQCLGIDVSKLSLSLSLCFLTWGLSKEYRSRPDVSNDLEGFKALSNWLLGLLDEGVDFIVVMEATGVYHQGVAHYLHGLGLKVSIMQSGRVKRYAQSLDQRSKTADPTFQPATPWRGLGSLIKCNEISQPTDSAK